MEPQTPSGEAQALLPPAHPPPPPQPLLLLLLPDLLCPLQRKVDGQRVVWVAGALGLLLPVPVSAKCHAQATAPLISLSSLFYIKTTFVFAFAGSKCERK
jgi:hypothetical protein